MDELAGGAAEHRNLEGGKRYLNADHTNREFLRVWPFIELGRRVLPGRLIAAH
jgi:hypothetical protein